MLATVWADLAQVVAPRHCLGCHHPGTDLCAACAAPLLGRAERCDPDPCPAGLPPTYAATAYDGVVREALAALKEHGRTGLLPVLGRGLAAAVALGCLSDAGSPGPAGPVVLVPVPSSPDAARRRDVAATGELARTAVRVLRAAGVPARRWDGVRATRRRADQTGLGVAGRAQNLHGSMAARHPVPAGTLVVVDDVVTTGATLLEASRAVRAAGGRVVACATVAATERRRHRAARPG